jgi:uncharacterized protein
LELGEIKTIIKAQFLKNNIQKLTLSEIWIYPVKSLSGFKLDEAVVEERGLQYDRRWVIVDENNRFVSQREASEMALINVKLQIDDHKLHSMVFSHKTKKLATYLLLNPENSNDGKKVEIEIWDDIIEGIEINDNINNWLSDILQKKCKLIYMPLGVERKVDPKYSKTGNDLTSFSDGYPFLIIGDESLKLLNSKLNIPVSIDRFRPNFVFTGGEAHDEDNWHHFMIGDVSFFGIKNCARCQVPNINQQNGEINKEPIKTLSTYRFLKNKVLFGQNMLFGTFGKVSVGNNLVILSKNK